MDLGNNAKFTGSARIVGDSSIQGFTKSTGSLEVNSNLQAVSGLSSLGFLGIDGNLLSQRNISIFGGSKVSGNMVAENIDVGSSRWYSFLKMQLFRPFRHPYEIKGNVFAKNKVNLTKTIIDGDVKGFDVKIGRKTEVGGQVFFVNSIKVKRTARLSNNPIQVKPEELKL